MKVDFKVHTTFIELIGGFLEQFGFVMAIFTFWLSHGFSLGGDPYFFGPFFSELEVIFPLCGVGIFLTFFGRFLKGTQKVVPREKILFFLIFLGFSALSSVFSTNPESSILFLILWGGAFLAMSFGEVFVISGKQKRTLFLFSVIGGILLSKFWLDALVSSQILAIMGLLGIIFALRENPFRGRTLLLLFYVWVLFSMGHVGIILCSLLVLLSSPLWLSPSRDSRRFLEITLPFLFLIGLSIWGIFSGTLSFGFHLGFLSGFLSNVQLLAFGVGEGQYLMGLQNYSDTLLLPESLILPSSSMLLTFFEKGLIGLLFLFVLLFLPLFFAERKRLFFSVLFLLLLLVSSDLLGLENGILFLMAFLFVDEGKCANGV